MPSVLYIQTLVWPYSELLIGVLKKMHHKHDDQYGFGTKSLSSESLIVLLLLCCGSLKIQFKKGPQESVIGSHEIFREREREKQMEVCSENDRRCTKIIY